MSNAVVAPKVPVSRPAAALRAALAKAPRDAASHCLRCERSHDACTCCADDPHGGVSFNLTLADGRKLAGVRVHGAGGEIGAGCYENRTHAKQHALKRLRGVVDLAENGRPLTVYEPKPGHVKVYVGAWKPSEDEETVEIVDIRGASVALARGGR